MGWPEEDTSISVSGPEQCDFWGPPLPPRMLFNPNPDPACPMYGYVPLDEEDSGSLANVLRWVKGVALSSLLNVTFVFGGKTRALNEEAALGLTDGIHKLHSLPGGREGGEKLATVDVPLDGVEMFSEALVRLEGVERKCGTIYRFEDINVGELGWAHLALAHAVQKHIADTKWKPTLWTTEALNLVVDMTGLDDTVDMGWTFQSLDTIFDVLNRSKKDPLLMVVVVDENSAMSKDTRTRFRSYGDVQFVVRPQSAAEHVKHLVAAADIVFCPRVDAAECHIASLAGTRPGFIIRSAGDGMNFCPGAGMCSLVSGNRPIAETDVAFVRGISERWNVGRSAKCL